MLESWEYNDHACNLFTKARWQSGDAAACKAVYTGSIPVLASIYRPGWRNG